MNQADVTKCWGTRSDQSGQIGQDYGDDTCEWFRQASVEVGSIGVHTVLKSLVEICIEMTSTLP